MNILHVFAGICLQCSAQKADLNLLRSINAAETDIKNGLFAFTSNTIYLVNVSVPAAIGLKGILSHDKRLKREALFMGGGLLLNTLPV